MVRYDFAGKMRGKRLARWSCLGKRLGHCHRFLELLFSRSLLRLCFFELQLELLNLNNDLLALRAEDHAAQLLDDQLQMFNLLSMGVETLTLLDNQYLQCFYIELVEVGKSGSNHDRSMP
jgi:hypothetical protein